MNIKDIIYFIEVVKEKSFTNASKKIYISQPALSKSIKKLEKDMNVELINRDTKNFSLTDEGKLFYDNAKRSIEVINAEMQKLEENFKIGRQVLRLGLPPIVGTIYFASIIAKFSHEYPNIDIKITEEGTNDIKYKIQDETIDLGIAVLPVEQTGIISEFIVSGDVVLVVSKNHKYASREFIDMNELKDEKFITFSNEFMMYNRTIRIAKESGFNPNIVMQTSQWDFIVEMVSLNQGVTIMPRKIVERFKDDSVSIVTITNINTKYDIGFISKENKHKSKAVNLFLEYVRDNITK